MEELKCKAPSGCCMHPWCECEEEPKAKVFPYMIGAMTDETNRRSMFAVIDRYECKITQDGWTAFIAHGHTEKQCMDRANKLVKLLNDEQNTSS